MGRPKLLVLLLWCPVAFVAACASRTTSQLSVGSSEPEESRGNRGISLPKIDRRPPAAVWSRDSIAALPSYGARGAEPLQVDLRSRDVSSLDLSGALGDLVFADFDSRTVWPPVQRMPVGFDREAILSLGANAGLGLRKLHSQGVTGRNVGIAIIDQTLLVDHQEYSDRLRLYEEDSDIRASSAPSQMHGPAVASIAVGRTVGVAPEADLYYIATALCGATTYESIDFGCLAKDVRRIVEVNRELPAHRKIRVLSISIGWHPYSVGYSEIRAATNLAKSEGMLVVCASMDDVHGFAFQGLGRAPMSDPDDFQSYTRALSWVEEYLPGQPRRNRLLVPMDSRTTASPTGVADYVFYRQGGTSWCIPFIAGLYALAAQARPDITASLFWDSALRTGRSVRSTEGAVASELGPIADPVALIEFLRGGAGTMRQ